MKTKTNVKGTVKDSVFTDLFSESKYLLQLYQALHPEDSGAREEDLKSVTLKNIFTDSIYNDLGFMKGDRLILMVEEQATWTANIIIRALEYLVHSYRRYFSDKKMDLYKSAKVKIPRPELYVIYTGNRKTRPSEISLSDEFFDGEKTAVEVSVKMIYDGKKGDIINQYITFTKIFHKQVKLHGKTRMAVQETIRICKGADVLGEYLKSRESEVVDIMMQLYDREEIMKMHDFGVAVRAAVETYRDCNMDFQDVVNRISVRFAISNELAEEKVEEYWEE